MQFNIENFLPLDIKQIPQCIRNMESSALVLIKKNGKIIYGRTRLDKQYLKDQIEEGDIVLFGWHGSYRTDIFSITKEEIEKYFTQEDFEKAHNVNTGLKKEKHTHTKPATREDLV